jgi:hypothetical protein
LSKLVLDIGDRIETAADDRARGVLILRLASRARMHIRASAS